MRRSPSPWSSVPTDPSTEDAEPNVASLCPQLKWRYERCFQHWYTADFLTGNSTQLPCQDEYKRYQQCILSRLDSELVQSLPLIDDRNPGALEKPPPSCDREQPASARPSTQPT